MRKTEGTTETRTGNTQQVPSTPEQSTTRDGKEATQGTETSLEPHQHWPNAAVGIAVAAAAGGGLLVATILGAGPAAVAGAAGYLAYRGLKQKRGESHPATEQAGARA